MKKHPAVAALEKASRTLRFPSETEAKLAPVILPEETTDLTEEGLLAWSGDPADTPVEPISLDELFRTIPRELRAKFNKLAYAIRKELSGVTVYKVGAEAEKAVYILGQTEDGRWAGLKTTVVET